MRTRPAGYLDQTGNLLNSLVMVLPVLILYQIGLVLTGYEATNGVDIFTTAIHRGWGTRGVLIVNLVLLGGFIVAVSILKGKNRLQPAVFLPTILESLLYAVSLGALITFIMRRSILAASTTIADLPVLDRIVLCLGAGVTEEIVFRLVLLAFFAVVVIGLFGAGSGVGFVVGAAVSSLLFAYAHYAGPAEVARDPYGFVYRFLAGLIFCVIAWYRSFAVAVYTHAFYDLLVLL